MSSDRSDNPERGAALLLVLLVLAAVGATLMTLASDTQVELSAAMNHASRLEAMYVAEAGVERAVAELSVDYTWRGSQPAHGIAFAPGDNQLNEGAYRVRITDYDGAMGVFAPGSLYVTAIGTSKRGLNRAVNLVVSERIAKPRPITAYASFSCGKLEQSGGDDTTDGGNVYAGAGAEVFGSVIRNGDLLVVGTVTIQAAGRIDQNGSASGNIATTGSLAAQIGGNARAGGVVTDHSKVVGTVTQASDLVPRYCVSGHADSTTLLNDLKPLRDTDIAKFIGQTSPLTTVGAGDWALHTNTVLQGTYRVAAGKMTTGPGVQLKYRGHVVIIVNPGPIEIGAGNIALDPGADDDESSLTLITTQDEIRFKAGAVANFRGYLHAGVVNTATVPPSLPAGGDVDVDSGALVNLVGGQIALGTQTSAAVGALNIVRPAEVPPVLDENFGLRALVAAWTEPDTVPVFP